MHQRRVFERYLKETEERQLFQTLRQFADVQARRDHAWMRLLRQTGIRVGSLAGLTVHDAQLALATKRLVLRAESAKGGHGYDVPVNTKARAALKDLLKVRREQGHAPLPDAPLIMSRHHRGMSIRSFQDRMRKWVRAAGLQVEASPHWFRHTLAKRIVQRSTASDPRAIVQHVLGHHSIMSTCVYTGPDREDEERAMEEAS